MTANTLATFVDRLANTDDPRSCWPYVGPGDTVHGGHRRVWIGGKRWLAHRLAYVMFVGPIPDGLLVRHAVCHNPPCCNPAHLKVGTQQDNMDDGRRLQTHCKRGHEFTEDNVFRSPPGDKRRRCRTCYLLRLEGLI